MLKEPATDTFIARLFNNQPDAVLWFSPVFENSIAGAVTDFEVQYYNQAAARLAGVSSGQLVGTRIRQLSLQKEPAALAVFEQCLWVWNTGRSQEDTYYSPEHDRYFHVQRSKVEGGILSITRDRSHDVKAEIERQEQEKNFQQILDTSADGIMLLKSIRNEKGEIIDFLLAHCNRKGIETGRFPPDAIGKPILQLLPHLKYSDQLKMHRTVVETGQPQRFETTFHTPEGKEYGWFIVSLTKLGDGVISTFVDVSEKKAFEQQLMQQKNLLNNILDASLSAVYTCEAIRDKEGAIIDFCFKQLNQRFREQMLDPKQEIIGKNLLQEFPAVRQTAMLDKLKQVVESGEPARFEVYYQQEDFHAWYDTSAVKLGQNDVVVTFANITEQKRTVLELERSLQELRRSNESLEEFTRAASHDLKEPIRKVQFFADRLKQRLQARLTEEERGMMERMENAAARMKLLVDDLLTYSHVNLQTTEKEEIDLGKKIRLVTTDLELLITEKKAVIKVEPMPVVKGFRRQLQQLFYNLLSNAVKYQKPGVPPVVTITSKQTTGATSGLKVAAADAEKAFHLLEFRDNGIGFEQEYADKIFHVFTRLHGNHEYTGTGVGLAIVRKVVENHQGYISAESSPGEGATFRVLLPA